MTLQKNFPVCITTPSGLKFEINANGSIKRMDHGDIMLNLFLGNEMEGGPANIYLRRKSAGVEAVPLLGPCSPASFRINGQGVIANGTWRGLRFLLRLVLAQSAPAWFWHVELENTGPETVTCDLMYTQDLGLAHYGAVRLNEYYVSHYIDHTPLNHPRHGVALASRQNQSMGGKCPWTVIGSLCRGVSYATDALQFYGLAARAGRTPVGLTEGLPGARRQHEHSMAAIQDCPVRLEPGEKAQRGFFGWFESDRQSATSEADLSFIDTALSLAEAVTVHAPQTAKDMQQAASLFCTAPLLDACELTEADITDLFGAKRRHEEREHSRLLSFFTGATSHVVLKEKELKALRPHGHLLRTGNALTPDETTLTSTTWMAGVFHSMVTQGHVSINRFLSTCHSYLGLFRSHGLRVFVEIEGCWHLLDVPSAYEMTPDSCRWIYSHQKGMLAVRSCGPADHHELSLSVEVLSGEPVRFFVSCHVAINGDDGSSARPVSYARDADGIFIRSLPDCDVGWRFPEGGFRIQTAPGTFIERLGGDELLFADDASRNQPFLCLVTAPALSIGFSITGCLIAQSAGSQQGPRNFWSAITAGLHIHPPAASPLAPAAARVAEILPWFIHNALIHYLSPRGLEQYSGGGWGTRDVSQGPVEMLISLGRFEPVRDILLRLFKQQNPDGDWPQWFMFFDRERGIRPGDSHGDIVYWPVLALAQYLLATEDAGLLDVLVPFFHPEGDGKAEQATLWQHVERALAVMNERIIPGTRLAAYGNGDWNDSLQPVQHGMREHLCSSWTVTLNYQTLITLAQALDRLGRCDRAAAFETAARATLENFQRILIVDDTITGFAYFRDGSRIDYLLHPRDKETGLSYSLLPMIHAVINGMLTPQQAQTHLCLIKEHLLGPEGAHLFDRPMQYHGGPQTYFQRAESTTFFGRENGLMYTHAHLRYAEALARFGDADGFFKALCQANPIAIGELVLPATLRQANCYYSSSDPAFADRYEAYAHYDKVKEGAVPLEGGWRVYSSGAGICVRLIMQNFLGLRWEKSRLTIDPVMPKALDRLHVELRLADQQFDVTYRIGENGCGPVSVQLNGVELPFTRNTNPYRTGAAEIPVETVLQHVNKGSNLLTVHVG
jgi:1,2-beta-oligoglucan phosphorylase